VKFPVVQKYLLMKPDLHFDEMIDPVLL